MYRLTPRGAVVIVARDPADPRFAVMARDVGNDRLAALLLATLRDAIAATVPVDGVSIIIVAPTPAAGAHLQQLLPAGLDIVAPSEPIPIGRMNHFALSAHESRGFERVVVIDGAVLGLTGRVVGTGLGALANADAVVGGDRQGSDYAFGILTRHIPTVLRAGILTDDGYHPAHEVQEQLRGLRLRSRRLDPLPTLDAFLTLSELRSALTGLPGLGRHIAAELSRSGWTEHVQIEQPRRIG